MAGGRHVPPWARRVAMIIPLLTIPTALWRLGWVLGFPLGWAEDRFQANTATWSAKLYLIGLCLLAEGAALLSLGLVRPWGEVVPRWVPGIGGRPIPPLAVLLPAGAGSAALIVMWTPAPLMFFQEPQAGAPDGNGWELLMALCYLPLALWGPMLAALTWAYHLRTRTPARLPAA
ncbi:hypothetical protein [Amycolatopsis aidingensis]|uniref:hypothetical protein n=1 Tax=Amycolatopsis aidingensis TaxID=2842453 RepID=UPI001C0D05F7|nr:hypothetical protein [Amycolatopsis aidingensis]